MKLSYYGFTVYLFMYCMYICDLYVKKLFLAYSQELIFTPAENVYSIRKKHNISYFVEKKIIRVHSM